MKGTGEVGVVLQYKTVVKTCGKNAPKVYNFEVLRTLMFLEHIII
jgi:hypothetical protein